MQIADEDLRALVRDVLRGLNRTTVPPEPAVSAAPSAVPHASHARLAWLVSGNPEGFCLIEPAVRCSHCGYCQSLGH